MEENCDRKKKITLPREIKAVDGEERKLCDIRTVLSIPDELKEPTPEALPIIHPLQTPGPILVFNHEQIVQCDKEVGQYGDDVVIPEHQLEKKVFLSVILSLTDEVLDYIAKHRLNYAIGDLFHRQALDEDSLASLTKMKVSEAKELLSTLQVTQDTLDDQTYQQAKSQLVCYYLNRPQTARCEDPNVLRPEEYAEAVYEVTVEAGQFLSYYSQEDADNKALEYAQSLLNCFYGNPEFIARCEERPTRPMDGMEPVPNDEIEIYPGRGLRVGVVVVPKNRFISYLSQEDALQKAQQWGYAQLVCWYPNDQVELSCGDPDARNEFIDPLVTDPAEADILSGIPGQHVLIPIGFFISELSRSDATTEAQLFAETLLKCCFINDELWARCEPEDVVAQDGLTYTVQPKQVENCEIYVPRGKYMSCRSKEEANEFARQSIDGMLVCLYCNVRVMPQCVPEWVIQGIKDKSILLPLSGGIITDGRNSISADKLPPEATVGIEEGTVCLPDAQRAQFLAEALAIVPASQGGYWCTCYSEEVVVGCAVSDPYGQVGQEGRGIKGDGEPYNFFSLLPPDATLSNTLSYPRRGEYIRFASGLYVYNCANLLDSDEEKATGAASVTQRVMDMAKSLLHCFVSNPPATGTCGGASSGDWNFGLGKEEGVQLTPWSNSSSHPISFPADIIFREVSTSIEGAYDSAMQSIFSETQAMIESTIICSYYNTEQEGACVPPESEIEITGADDELPRLVTTLTTTYRPANTAIVPAKTIISADPRTADELAKKMAQALGACDVDTVASYSVEIPDIPDIGGGGWWPWPDMGSSSPPHIPIPPPDDGDEHSSSSPPGPEIQSKPEGAECWNSFCPNVETCRWSCGEWALSRKHQEEDGEKTYFYSVLGCICAPEGGYASIRLNHVSDTLVTYKESYVKQCNALRDRITLLKSEIKKYENEN